MCSISCGVYHISRTGTWTVVNCLVSLGLVRTGAVVDCIISVRLVLGKKLTVGYQSTGTAAALSL